MRKGFTIIEFCLGLVIIGIIVGSGSLAINIIQAAKVDRIARSLASAQDATAAFVKRYGALPGDSAAFLPRGNEDGLLEVGEVESFWLHINKAELVIKAQKDVKILPKTDAQGKFAFELALPSSEAQLLKTKMGKRGFVEVAGGKLLFFSASQ